MKAMERANHLRLIEQLDLPPTDPPFEIAAERYLSPTQLDRERPLFRGPRIATIASAIAPGSCVPIGSAIVVRDAGGELRAFENACRHRGTRLVDAPCAAKAFVCPYHGWTYDATGALIHVPHEATFAGLDRHARGLVPVPVAERHGLVWLGGEPAAELDGDLAAIGFDRHVVWRTARVTRRCNWKLVVEAFLDGYHIRVLHRDSIYRFFLDAQSTAEAAGPHIRAISGRRTMREGGEELRALATPSYLVFPATVIIEHPDFVSILALSPIAPELTEWTHTMVIPAERVGEVDHWNRSWQLIEEMVFQREDLWVCEQIQQSLSARSTDRLLFGSLENAIGWFHASIDRMT